jgi:maltose O-acetyltransferase
MLNLLSFLAEIKRKIRINRLIRRGLKLGKNCTIMKTVIIDPSFLHLIEIGDNVTITDGVEILAHDASTKMHLGLTRIGKVKIGDNVFIGVKSIILPNITIGSNSIIGSGSVVTNDIPSDVIVAGNPAEIIYPLEVFLDKHRGRMKMSPCFGEEYTIGRKISVRMKAEMNECMINDQGYIV